MLANFLDGCRTLAARASFDFVADIKRLAAAWTLNAATAAPSVVSGHSHTTWETLSNILPIFQIVMAVASTCYTVTLWRKARIELKRLRENPQTPPSPAGTEPDIVD